MAAIDGIFGDKSFHYRTGAARGGVDYSASALAIRRVRAKALERIGDDLRTLGRALDGIRDLDGIRATRTGATAASSSSRSDLDLGTFSTYATLTSSAEVNTTPTSFTPFGPTVSGASTTLPTLGGVYDGSDGDDVLSFEFRQNSVVGSGAKLRVRVRNGAGQVIDHLNFDSVAANEPVTLRNGLTLSLDEGFAVRKDTFEVAVSATQGSAVDPDLAFDGTRNQNPNFELGQSVIAGSFEINGVSIAVGASDTLNSVLATINSSAAGVDAVFDVASESVVLTQRTPGAAPTIQLANDTSGFLAATKLDTAAVVPGVEGDNALLPMAEVPLFAGVVVGSITVNGVAIAVDPAVDSVQDVLERVSASSAGVLASLDPTGNRVTFAALDPRGALELGDGGTGFLAAIDVAEGRVEARGRARSSGPRLEDADAVRDRLGDVARALQGIFGGRSAGLADSDLEPVRAGLEEALRAAFDRLDGVDSSRRGALRSGLGIALKTDDRRGEVLDLDFRRFDRAAIDDANSLNGFLFAAANSRGEEAGLVPSLLAALEAAQRHVATELGQIDLTTGRRVDFFA